MKTKILTTFILSAILLTTLASANVFETNYVFDGVFDNGEYILGDNELDNVQIRGYVCLDEDCATGYPLWPNQKTITTGRDNKVILEYPEVLPEEHGYLIYYLKPGYFANTYRSDWYGNGDAGEYDRYLFKMEDQVSAQIEDFEISDKSIKTGETITISANILSVMLYNEETRYIPDELVEDYYSDHVKVGLRIKNKDTGAIYHQVLSEKMEWSSEKEIELEWTPKYEGDYLVEFYTEVLDEKFLNTEIEKVESEIKVKGTQDPDDDEDDDKENKYPRGFKDLVDTTLEDDKYQNQYDQTNQPDDEDLQGDSDWEWYLSGAIILIVLILIIIGVILGRE